jgi:hypothetical protein
LVVVVVAGVGDGVVYHTHSSALQPRIKQEETTHK